MKVLDRDEVGGLLADALSDLAEHELRRGLELVVPEHEGSVEDAHQHREQLLALLGNDVESLPEQVREVRKGGIEIGLGLLDCRPVLVGGQHFFRPLPLLRFFTSTSFLRLRLRFAFGSGFTAGNRLRGGHHPPGRRRHHVRRCRRAWLGWRRRLAFLRDVDRGLYLGGPPGDRGLLGVGGGLDRGGVGNSRGGVRDYLGDNVLRVRRGRRNNVRSCGRLLSIVRHAQQGPVEAVALGGSAHLLRVGLVGVEDDYPMFGPNLHEVVRVVWNLFPWGDEGGLLRRVRVRGQPDLFVDRGGVLGDGRAAWGRLSGLHYRNRGGAGRGRRCRAGRAGRGRRCRAGRGRPGAGRRYIGGRGDYLDVVGRLIGQWKNGAIPGQYPRPFRRTPPPSLPGRRRGIRYALHEGANQTLLIDRAPVRSPVHDQVLRQPLGCLLCVTATDRPREPFDELRKPPAASGFLRSLGDGSSERPLEMSGDVPDTKPPLDQGSDGRVTGGLGERLLQVDRFLGILLPLHLALEGVVGLRGPHGRNGPSRTGNHRGCYASGGSSQTLGRLGEECIPIPW